MNDLLLIGIRTLSGYLILLVLLKIMGKREVGQLSVFDLLIFLSIADIMVIGIENFDENVLYVVIPVLLLTIIQKIFAFLILKNNFFRSLIDGKESLIINDGIIDINEMLKQCYNYDDLISQLRTMSISTIEDVQYAILENSGRLSVIKYQNNQENIFPLPVIMSGKIVKKNLKLLKVDHLQIEKLIKEKKIKIEDVEFAFYKLKTNDLVVYIRKGKTSTLLQ